MKVLKMSFLDGAQMFFDFNHDVHGHECIL